MIDLVDAATMAALDRRTIEEIGLPGAVLMETAGRSVERAILERFGAEPRRVAIVAGRGNNGGDGHVVGRLLLERGWSVEIALAGTRDRVQGDAALHLDAYLACGGRLTELEEASGIAPWAAAAAPDLVVDALFGTGFVGEVRGLGADLIDWMLEQPVPVVAVDVPSGLDASSGRVGGRASRAELTVTFGAGKLGHVLPPGDEHCGEVRVAEIGIPVTRWRREAPDRVRWLGPEVMEAWTAPRRAQAHKGSFGHVLVIAGSAGKGGAAALAARGALRWGAGLVTVATPASVAERIEGLALEAMTAPIDDRSSGYLGREHGDRLLELAEGKGAVVLGPGIGTEEETVRLVHLLLDRLAVPVVLDADGLNAWAEGPAGLGADRAPRVLTPHPGEMGRILDLSSAQVQEARLECARSVSRTHGGVTVLKGAGTIVARPVGAAAINSSGNAGMASGGMGDVLAGMIGAALAAGGDAAQAAEAAVYLHGVAADRLRPRGRGGLLASEVADALPESLEAIGEGARPRRRLEWLTP